MLVKRTLCIMVERTQKDKDVFATAVTSALREYADAVDKTSTAHSPGGNGPGRYDKETFRATNGCMIRTEHKKTAVKS